MIRNGTTALRGSLRCSVLPFARLGVLIPIDAPFPLPVSPLQHSFFLHRIFVFAFVFLSLTFFLLSAFDGTKHAARSGAFEFDCFAVIPVFSFVALK